MKLMSDMPCDAIRDDDVRGSISGCYACAFVEGAAVAFGLIGMAEAIRAMPHYAPCDEPYPDCKVCAGTGKSNHYPCPSCVWRRWAASADLISPEELDAERHGEEP